jgi:hypothetical protein
MQCNAIFSEFRGHLFSFISLGIFFLFLSIVELETINLVARSGQFVYDLSIVDDEMVKKMRARMNREREKS